MFLEPHSKGMTRELFNGLTMMERAGAWKRLSTAEKTACRSDAGLTKQLVGLERHRVEVVTDYGETRRFWVGKSTGWQPCHLEVKTTRSMGGEACHSAYDSVRVIYYPSEL
jgi:hypothetical protein